jgi:tripartite-type tricarboxylate transporter receptor subunit TctC
VDQGVNAGVRSLTLYDKLNFVFLRDIAPVAGIIRLPLVMVVNPSVPAKTVPEFTAYAKANPGKINLGSPGLGTSPHVAGELFKMMTGTDMLLVSYRGVAPAVTDLLGGQVQTMFNSLPASIEYIKAGTLRALAVTTREALGDAARHPNYGRVRARLRGQPVVWHRRPQGHARRDRQPAQQGD